MSTAAGPDLASIPQRIQSEVQRAIQRSIKGVEYISSSGPLLGSTPKDILHVRGTKNLYHYRPTADEVYRVPILIVMATTNRGRDGIPTATVRSQRPPWRPTWRRRFFPARFRIMSAALDPGTLNGRRCRRSCFSLQARSLPLSTLLKGWKLMPRACVPILTRPAA